MDIFGLVILLGIATVSYGSILFLLHIEKTRADAAEQIVDIQAEWMDVKDDHIKSLSESYCELKNLQHRYRFVVERRKAAMKDYIDALEARRYSLESILGMHGCDLRERIAEVQHGIWSHWMKYLFNQCTDVDTEDDRVVAIPPDLEKRWRRQMWTNYRDLPEHERESDRHQADKVLEVLNGCEDKS